MPGNATRRMLQRSIRLPIAGTASAPRMPPNDSANDVSPRSQPMSSVNGLRNMPKVKPKTGPLHTSSPVTAPATTHQGLENLGHIGAALPVLVLSGGTLLRLSEHPPPAPCQRHRQKTLNSAHGRRPRRADRLGQETDMQEAEEARADAQRQHPIEPAAHLRRGGEIDQRRLH